MQEKVVSRFFFSPFAFVSRDLKTNKRKCVKLKFGYLILRTERYKIWAVESLLQATTIISIGPKKYSLTFPPYCTHLMWQKDSRYCVWDPVPGFSSHSYSNVSFMALFFCAHILKIYILASFQCFQSLSSQDKDILLCGRKCRRHVPVS